MQYRLGRQPRSRDARVPHMSALTAGRKLLPPPPSIDWTKGMPPDFGMMLNDQLGDCTCAAVYHARQVWTFNATAMEDTEPDAGVLSLYETTCGYVRGNPDTDQGGNEQTVLRYLLNHGMPLAKGGVDKIAAFVEIDPRNVNDVKRGIANNGLVYIGFQVPAFLLAGEPPALWDVDPNGDQEIIGGHAVILPSYTIGDLGVISWGARYAMTWRFFTEFVDEVYAIADPAWISAKGTTPGGLTLAQLEAQMTALRA
jgi:hypothetical protein